MPNDQKAENLPQALPDIETEEGRGEVIKRASNGDESVRGMVRKLLDRDQRDGGKLLEAYGNNFRHAALDMTKPLSGDNLMYREGLLRKIYAVRDELAGPNPTPLERLLCERVALCWFDANEMDRRYNDHKGVNLTLAGWHEGRRDRAQKRFLAACKTLATVRKLALPAIQVNIGENQMNVMNP